MKKTDQSVKPPQREVLRRRQVRLASLVIAGAFALWMGVSFLGAELGLPPRFAILADMLCLAALAWALWLIFNVWRDDRRAGKE